MDEKPMDVLISRKKDVLNKLLASAPKDKPMALGKLSKQEIKNLKNLTGMKMDSKNIHLEDKPTKDTSKREKEKKDKNQSRIKKAL